MATTKDFYQVLGVDKKANKDTIKSAYRKLAKQYHPDVNKEKDAEKKFKEVQEAYDTLYDDQKRSVYDQVGHEAYKSGAQQGGPGRGAGGFGGFNGTGGFGGFGQDLGDIFGSFFGGGQARQQSRPSTGPVRGNDLLMQMRISFMDSINGKEVVVPLNVDEPCPICHGTGAKTPQDIITCPTCKGRGVVRQVSQTFFGAMEHEVSCPQCHGSGKIIKEKCLNCRGSGYVRKKVEKNLKIPAGINNGQQLRIAGFGGRGVRGGPNGDLHVEINVTAHPFYKRNGNDIHLDVPVPFTDMILGAELEIPTVYGNVLTKIPAGSHDGQILRMKGKGVKNKINNVIGDQFIRLKIAIPKKLDKKQREIIENYRKNDAESANEYRRFVNTLNK